MARPLHELLPDGTLGDAEEEIDNLARSVHAGPIGDRHRQGLLVFCAVSDAIAVSVTSTRRPRQCGIAIGSRSRSTIHLRFDSAVRAIEVGYVGGHLPLS